jgi:opacity protein-like surface antigen
MPIMHSTRQQIRQPLRWVSLTAASVLALAASAHAATKGFYFAGYMGLNVPKTEYKSSNDTGAFSGAMGLRLSPHWRVESELNYGDDDMARTNYNQAETPIGSRFKSYSGLVNFYYNFDTPGDIKPFVGGGVGFSTSEHKNQQGSFAWQLGGGLNYQFNPSLSFSSAYRFYDSVEDTSVDSLSGEGHEFRVGVTYKLPVKPRRPDRSEPAFRHAPSFAKKKFND